MISYKVVFSRLFLFLRRPRLLSNGIFLNSGKYLYIIFLVDCINNLFLRGKEKYILARETSAKGEIVSNRSLSIKFDIFE